MLDKETKNYLDSLDDEMLIAEFIMRYSIVEPVWEECSQQEYEKYYDIGDYGSLTIDKLKKVLENVWIGREYMKVPVYKDAKCGILWQLSEKPKPDGYKYYKKVGEKNLLCVGTDIFEYCKTRDCMKPFFESSSIQYNNQ